MKLASLHDGSRDAGCGRADKAEIANNIRRQYCREFPPHRPPRKKALLGCTGATARHQKCPA